ncbi:MAG: hypothetical protein Ct9H90mP30_4370 [Actinomycetota bacterium]|nr:MAG: hypothetical protein Ct9H90mP30_4370 [Actinomycetota bacterium]
MGDFGESRQKVTTGRLFSASSLTQWVTQMDHSRYVAAFYDHDALAGAFFGTGKIKASLKPTKMEMTFGVMAGILMTAQMTRIFVSMV